MLSVNLLRPIITIRIKYDTFTRTALAALAFCFGGCLYFTGHHWHADDAGAVCAAAGERYGVVDCGSEPGDCGNAADVGRVAAFVGRAVRPFRCVARAVDGVADAGCRLAAGVVHAHAVRLVGGHGAAGGLGHGRRQLVDFDEPDCQPPARKNARAGFGRGKCWRLVRAVCVRAHAAMVDFAAPIGLARRNVGAGGVGGVDFAGRTLAVARRA